MKLRVFGNIEHVVHPIHDVGVQCRQNRADAQRPCRQQQILNCRENRRCAAGPTLDTVEILESYVPESRVHEFIDNPTDAVIAEG